MKKILMMGMALVATQAIMAQITYEVTLQESDLKGKAYLISLEDMHLIDSTDVNQNGSVHFKGKTAEPVMACISGSCSQNDNTCILVLDETPLKMEKVNNGEIRLKKASETNRKFQEILNRLHEAGSRNVSLIQEYNALIQQGQAEESTLQRIKKERESIKEEIKGILRQGITENQNNIIPVLLLQQGMEDVGTEFAEKFLADYRYKDRASLKNVHQKIKAEKAKAEGGKLIELTLPDLEGKERNLSDFVGKGKYVLVDFWASWCGPCRQEMPHVKAAYNKFKEKGFDIVGISFDKDKTAWERAIKQMELEWHHLSDLKGWYSKAAQAYNIRSIPATILFDPEGHIVTTNLRGAQLEEKLRELLK